MPDYNTARIYGGDIKRLRQGYLFPFAHFCAISPAEMDRLRMTDFAQLVIEVDAHIDALQKQNQEG